MIAMSNSTNRTILTSSLSHIHHLTPLCLILKYLPWLPHICPFQRRGLFVVPTWLPHSCLCAPAATESSNMPSLPLTQANPTPFFKAHLNTQLFSSECAFNSSQLAFNSSQQWPLKSWTAVTSISTLHFHIDYVQSRTWLWVLCKLSLLHLCKYPPSSNCKHLEGRGSVDKLKWLAKSTTAVILFLTPNLFLCSLWI